MKHTYSSLLSHWLARPLAALGLLLATAGAAHAQAITFGPMATYPVGGTQNYYIATGDLNGDGVLDLVSSNNRSSNVSVLLGQAAGGFAAAVTYATGNTAEEIVLADINGDTRLDVVLTSFSGVNVLLGTGTGTLGVSSTYPTGAGNGFNVQLYDVTRDGILDAVTANASALASVLPGTAAGTFGPATNYTAGSSLRGVRVADFNRDGFADLAISDAGQTNVYVLLGQASGFAAPASYPIGQNSYFLEIADLNRDGQLDVIVSGNGTSIKVLTGNANGTFNAAMAYLASTTSTFLTGLTVGDGNGDGYPDVLVADADQKKVYALPGSSTGALGTAVAFGVGTFVYDITLTDINRDGRPDLVVANSNDNNIGVLLNTTVFAAVPTITSLSPTTGPVGTSVTLTGTNFTGAQAVRFNGTAASSFVINSATSITAVVAAGTTTGFVTVTTPSGTATSPTSFVVRVAPTTVADAYSTPQGVTLTGNVLTNDLGTNPRAILITRPANGTLVLNPDGSFTYRPNAGFTGTDTFTYYACDPNMPLLCGNPATVTISVLRIAPVTVADSYTTPAGTTLTGNVLTNDLGTNPRAILITRPTRGTLVLNPDGSFTYQPNAGYTGPDSFTYYACDPALPLLCGNPATVSITVTRVAPITVADAYTTPQGVTLTGNVLTNDIGTNPRAILITRPANGVLVLNPDGSFSYRPNAGFTGADSFTYYACDPNMPLLCGNPATVSITVTRVAPVTVADAYGTPQNVTLTGNVLTNDLGTNPRAILINRPTRGTLVLNPNGSFSYQPNAGFTGADSFTYYACDPNMPLLCGNPATVSITVTPAASARSAATAAQPAATATKPTAAPTGAAAGAEMALTGSPNPFGEQLRLSFALPTAQAYTLAMYDAQGRLVQQLASGQAEASQAQQLEVPTHTYATGLYFVRLTTATGTQLLKLIKQ